MVSRPDSATSPLFLWSNFTYGRGTFAEFSNYPILEKGPYYSKVIFSVNLSNSFDLQETSVTGVFEVPELESSVKIEVAPFPVPLG